MKILMVHNKHRHGAPSGDDIVFENESSLLRQRGHKVLAYERSNDEFFYEPPIKKMQSLIHSVWSIKSYKDIKKVIKKSSPHIVHFHNIFPLISPSAYRACQELGIPVVQTLHDFRFLCPMAFFFRNGTICEECMKSGLWKSIKYGCFQDSHMQSACVAFILWFHKLLNVWSRNVDLFLCLTQTERNKFSEAGFPKNRIFLKPNFLPNPPKSSANNGSYAIFMGRLGHEKGVAVLLQAWKNLQNIPLKILGDGPQRKEFKNISSKLALHSVEFLGLRPHTEAIEILQNSKIIIMPSIWYETFGLTIIEAFACAKPVIASNLGAMADLVTDGETGLLFEPGNPSDLADKVRWLWEHDDEVLRMGENARKEFEAKYTAETNYKMLMEIYEKAIELHKRSSKIS